MSPIVCLYTVALLFIISVMASRNNVFLQRDLALFSSKTCLKSKQNHWWLLKNGASALFSICKSSEELQYRIPFFRRLFCEKTFDGKVGGDDRTLWIFHGPGSQSMMTCSSQLPGNMSLGQKKKKWWLDCSFETAVNCNDVYHCWVDVCVVTSQCDCPCWVAPRNLTGNVWGKEFLVTR